MINKIKIRGLVDKYFSLQWCRENIVVPLGYEKNDEGNDSRLIIAIGNISYLGAIGDFIKKEPQAKERNASLLKGKRMKFNNF